MLEKIKSELKDNLSLDKLKEKLHIPIFILYECDITKNSNEFGQEYKNKLREESKINTDKLYQEMQNLKDIAHLNKIFFHIILFPIPCKQSIMDHFNNTLRGF